MARSTYRTNITFVDSGKCVDCGRIGTRRSNFGPAPKRCAACAAATTDSLALSRYRYQQRPRGSYESAGGTCSDCGSATHRRGKYGPHPKRCEACSDAHRRERSRAVSAAWRERNPNAVREGYRRWYSENAEKKRDESLNWYRNNQDRAKQTNSTWYRDNVDKSRAKARARRVIKRGGDSEKFFAAEIFKRDEWVCQLCGGKVDPALRHPDPLSASLDHVVPVSKGGGHTRANVQLAHLVCNTARGNGDLEEILAEVNEPPLDPEESDVPTGRMGDVS